MRSDRALEPEAAYGGSGCKGCSETVRQSPEQIAEWMRRRMSGPDWPAVADDEYARRLAACRSCPSLAYGTTCRICGCLVQVRARLPDARCPYPYEPKW